MKLLVFQHIDCEHPGSLRQFLKRDNITWDAVNLHRNEAIPNLSDYQALWVMGGPMDVWDVEEHPWLVEEKKAIRHFVEQLKRPYLGLCLGHQLLADALDGSCAPMQPAEIGLLNVSLTPAGMADPLFQGIAAQQRFLQWHSVQVSKTPTNTEILASSELCPIQAMRVGDVAWSMQFHAELENDTVSNWGEVPAYAKALEIALGPDGLQQMSDAADQEMINCLQTAGRLYDNFMTIMRHAS